MAGAAVFIATTVGPVRVRQIRVDTSTAVPAVSVNFDPKTPHLMAGYQQFVSQPNGTIYKFTGGEERFRTQISADILQGESWQLGMFVAFALRDNDALCELNSIAPSELGPEEELQDAEELVWATGAVKSDLREVSVEGVTRIPEKLETSRLLFSAAAAKGLPILILLPEANRSPEVEQALEDIREDFKADVRFLSRVEFWRHPWERQKGTASSPGIGGSLAPPKSLSPKAERERASAFLERMGWGGALALAAIVLTTAFFTDFMAVQDRVCSIGGSKSGLADMCGMAHLGNMPARDAREAFERIKPGDCEALGDFQHQFPDSPLISRVHQLLADKRLRQVPDQKGEEHAFAFQYPVPTDGALGASNIDAARELARRAGLQKAEAEYCVGFSHDPYKFVRAELTNAHNWQCLSLPGGRYVCGFEASGTCHVLHNVPRTLIGCGAAP